MFPRLVIVLGLFCLALIGPALRADDASPAAPASTRLSKLDLPAPTPEDPTPNISPTENLDNPSVEPFQTELATARQLAADGQFDAASHSYVALLEGHAPDDVKRIVLLELAVTTHENHQPVKALQILAQFIKEYPRDRALPEVLFRQGLIYRQMGANGLAIAKFYAVMTAAISLKVDQLEHYQELVRQAQTDIAVTYFEAGQYREAVAFFNRLLKQDPAREDYALLKFHLIQSLAHLTDSAETVTQSETFLRDYPSSPNAAEVRFLLAEALKSQGRDAESLQQILQLLQSQHALAQDQPDAWNYWQRRAGNEFANALFLQGDYFNALTLYQHLAKLDASPAWQLPNLYQEGLILERLEQSDQAAEIYDRILTRQKELTDQPPQPCLDALFQMAQLRKGHLDWLQQAHTNLLSFHYNKGPNHSSLGP